MAFHFKWLIIIVYFMIVGGQNTGWNDGQYRINNASKIKNVG
jgi:hypothetical protein